MRVRRAFRQRLYSLLCISSLDRQWWTCWPERRCRQRSTKETDDTIAAERVAVLTNVSRRSETVCHSLLLLIPCRR